MKKLGKMILLGIMALGLMAVVYLYIVPYFVPLEFTGRTVPYRYRIIGNHAEILEYTGGEEEVVIPERLMGHKVTVLGDNSFTDNVAIKKVIIPDCVVEMEYCIFWCCENLEEVHLPQNIEIIPTKLFNGCDSLKDIILPEGIKTIESGAFSYCNSLTEVVIPDSVESIEEEAFYSCSSLEEVTIPKGVKRIDSDAFGETPWLKKQTEEFVIAGDNVLIAYNGEDSVINIPDGITYVGEDFFWENETIIKVVFPKSVTELGYCVFCYNENLEYIVLENDDIILNPVIIYEAENATIVSREGSTGQKYAQENNIPWKELEE